MVETDSPIRELRALLMLVLAAAAVQPASAQERPDRSPADSESVPTVAPFAGVEVTREALRERIDSLRRVMSDTEDPERRDRMTRRIGDVQARLDHGDFRSGDLVLVQVVGQERLSGKVTVRSDRSIVLPGLDERVDLGGLLYSEADERVQAALTDYVRDPRVRVRPLTRIAVLGGVGRPGFYDVSPGAPLADVIMAAGGPTGEAKLSEMEIRRGDRDLLGGLSLEPASTTLEELGVRRGDEVYLPVSRPGNTLRWIGIGLGFVSSITFLVVRGF